jgi:UDP-glucuronate 4-epimerase
MASVLLTGSAGFIGFHVARRLLSEGHRVTGIDNLNDYYDVGLKKARLEQLTAHANFSFVKADIADRGRMAGLFESDHYDQVLNLAAQVGPRYSLINPHAYAETNVLGFVNILEGCRKSGVKHLVFASSSSVYGANSKIPFSTRDRADHPISLYAATKRANELMAYTYAHLFGIPCTGLRFFTVYGPWGRPDMAPFLFTKAILEDRAIDVFNFGQMRRDFTYIDDVVECVTRVLGATPEPRREEDKEGEGLATSSPPYRVYNIGNDSPVDLMRFIQLIEEATGKKAKLNLLPLQPGDVAATWADVDDLARDLNFRPRTSIEAGIRRFVAWYRAYYRV